MVQHSRRSTRPCPLSTAALPQLRVAGKRSEIHRRIRLSRRDFTSGHSGDGSLVPRRIIGPSTVLPSMATTSPGSNSAMAWVQDCNCTGSRRANTSRCRQFQEGLKPGPSEEFMWRSAPRWLRQVPWVVLHRAQPQDRLPAGPCVPVVGLQTDPPCRRRLCPSSGKGQRFTAASGFPGGISRRVLEGMAHQQVLAPGVHISRYLPVRCQGVPYQVHPISSVR